MKTNLKFRVGLFFIVTALCGIGGAGCAHHRDVRAGSKGVHRVVVRSQTKEMAETSAIDQADHFCEERYQKHAAFVDEEKTQYEGTMDESTRNTVRAASAGAMVGGALIGKTTGTALMGAGAVGGAMTSQNDYKADMKFKCE